MSIQYGGSQKGDHDGNHWDEAKGCEVLEAGFQGTKTERAERLEILRTNQGIPIPILLLETEVRRR